MVPSRSVSFTVSVLLHSRPPKATYPGRER
jgi:hypothetical protein